MSKTPDRGIGNRSIPPTLPHPTPIGSSESLVTEHLALVASMLLVVVLSACAPQTSTQATGTGVEGEPQNSTGITVFGDARLGVTFD